MKYVSPESSPSLSLPVIGLGTYHLLDRMTDDGAIRAIHGAHAAGVDFIDTSDNYMNERLIGRAVAESPEPGRIIVATKTGLATTYDEHLRFIAQKRSADLSPERIRHQIEVSLGTLGMSKVDIYQIHAYDYLTPASDVVQTMGDLHHKDMFSVWGGFKLQ